MPTSVPNFNIPTPLLYLRFRRRLISTTVTVFYLVLYRSTFELTLNFCTAPMVYVVIGALEILNDDDDDDD